MSVIITPSHTCGPLFGFAILPAGIDHAVPATDPRAIVIEGEVLDHKGQHLNFDAFLEFWTQDQACRARRETPQDFEEAAAEFMGSFALADDETFEETLAAFDEAAATLLAQIAATK